MLIQTTADGRPEAMVNCDHVRLEEFIRLLRNAAQGFADPEVELCDASFYIRNARE